MISSFPRNGSVPTSILESRADPGKVALESYGLHQACCVVGAPWAGFFPHFSHTGKHTYAVLEVSTPTVFFSRASDHEDCSIPWVLFPGSCRPDCPGLLPRPGNADSDVRKIEGEEEEGVPPLGHRVRAVPQLEAHCV